MSLSYPPFSRLRFVLVFALLLALASGGPRLLDGHAAGRLWAQVQPTGDAARTFDVASVRPNDSGDGRVAIQIPPGRFNVTNAPVRMLIRYAFDLQDSQIVGGPGWIDNDSFDVVASTGGEVVAPDDLRLMTQALLAERFGLQVRREVQELPIFELVLAREDGEFGPSLTRSETDCEAQVAATRRQGGAGAPGRQGGPAQLGCGMRIAGGTMTANGMRLDQLATSLAPFVGRVVVDRTDLTDAFDYELLWTPDQLGAGGPPGAAAPPVDGDRPSIFTALQEQLGLRLNAARGPVEVLVIDAISSPSPD